MPSKPLLTNITFKSEVLMVNTLKLMITSMISLTREDSVEVKLNLSRTCMMVLKP
jgi:hypothetical protein